MALEREVKLAFENVEAARQAVHAAGGRLVVSRRIIDDVLFDTADARLRVSGCALRVRRDAARAFVTFKGPVQAADVKTREELETTVGDASVFDRVLTSLGFVPMFRSQKYREEFAIGAASVVIDETAIGVFVEIEAAADEIVRVAALLGRAPDDYRLESYATLWRRWCEAHGRPFGDMLLE